ncbi:hypothetical protein V8C44DRAFT_113254 [Trichoderma aethiopicum]
MMRRNPTKRPMTRAHKQNDSLLDTAISHVRLYCTRLAGLVAMLLIPRSTRKIALSPSYAQYSPRACGADLPKRQKLLDSAGLCMTLATTPLFHRIQIESATGVAWWRWYIFVTEGRANLESRTSFFISFLMEQPRTLSYMSRAAAPCCDGDRNLEACKFIRRREAVLVKEPGFTEYGARSSAWGMETQHDAGRGSFAQKKLLARERPAPSESRQDAHGSLHSSSWTAAVPERGMKLRTL